MAHITSEDLALSWQESSLLSALRCNLGVGRASALKSTSRSINNHLEQRDELFCNADHDAATATSFAASSGASQAARSGRSNWCRWTHLMGYGAGRCAAVVQKRCIGLRGHGGQVVPGVVSHRSQLGVLIGRIARSLIYTKSLRAVSTLKGPQVELFCED